ncbi:hypothetical protein VTH06DRAFT_4655 [Thermothelomyces fergusii]
MYKGNKQAIYIVEEFGEQWGASQQDRHQQGQREHVSGRWHDHNNKHQYCTRGYFYPGILDSSHAARPAPPRLFELAPPTAGFSQDFFLNILPGTSNRVYPVNPVPTPEEMRSTMGNMQASCSDAALIYAFGAIILNLTQPS